MKNKYFLLRQRKQVWEQAARRFNEEEVKEERSATHTADWQLASGIHLDSDSAVIKFFFRV